MSTPTRRDRDVRTARRELMAGSAVLALIALIAYMSTVAIQGSPFDSAPSYEVELASSGPLLRKGAEVRIGGRRAGEVRAVRLAGRLPVARIELDGSDGL